MGTVTRMGMTVSEPHLDWATCTAQAGVETLVDAVRRHVPGAIGVRTCEPKDKGYARAWHVVDIHGDPLCLIEGGAPHGWDLVTATGTQPNGAVRDAVAGLARRGVAARATRLDSAFDIFGGDFDRIADAVKVAAQTPHGGAPVRSFERWDSPHGATLYVGSRAASVRVRVYQKGLEQRGKGNVAAPLDWVRVELQWRPQKTMRAAALLLSPLEVWGASEWTADVAAQLMGVDVEHVHAAHEHTPFEDSYAWLLRSASGVFARAVDRLGMDVVVAELMDCATGRADADAVAHDARRA